MHKKFTFTSLFCLFLLITHTMTLCMDDQKSPREDQPDTEETKWPMVVYQGGHDTPPDQIDNEKFEHSFLIVSTTSNTNKLNDIDPKLIERIIIPTTPMTQGMGLVWTLSTSLGSVTTSLFSGTMPQCKRGHSILNDMQANRITASNTSCHHLCDEALGQFSLSGDLDNLIQLITTWHDKHYEQIVPSQIPTQQAHHTLQTAKTTSLQTLKDKHSMLNTKTFEQVNALTLTIQQQFQSYINGIAELIRQHHEKSAFISNVHGNEYRRAKKGLCLLHKLKGTTTLNAQDECSDYEDFTVDSKKVIKDPTKIDATYDNQQLLRKTKIISDNDLVATLLTIRKGKIDIINKNIATLHDLSSSQK